jgi:EAL and modified HD-GYP domain-containing signal transduction protein
LEGSAYLFDPALLGVEVLESVVVDAELESTLRKLRGAGYRISLDDYRPGRTPELLDLANMVKVDVQEGDLDELPLLIAVARKAGVTLLAEKVETKLEYNKYKRMGFSLFQGFYFARPEPVSGGRTDGDRSSLIHLLAALQNPNISMDRIATLITNNVSLATKVLQLLNSAAIGLPRRVASIHEAVVMIGTERLRRWASLLVLSSFTDKPRQLMEMALVRARMCELAATELAMGDPDVFFTVGLLSVADALMDRPMAKVVASLPLNNEVSVALTDRAGPAGAALEIALAFEGATLRSTREMPATPRRLAETYLHALSWAEGVLGSMGGPTRLSTALAG